MEYYRAMEEILDSKPVPHKIRPVRLSCWAVKRPWLSRAQDPGASETTVGGLILRLYLLVMDAEGTSLPVAVGVVDKLMPLIRHSTFAQVEAGYHLVWEAAIASDVAPPEMKNLLIVAMLGLAQLISARFLGIECAAWPQDVMSFFTRPDTNLVANVSKALITSSTSDQVQAKLLHKCITRLRYFEGRDTQAELSLVTDKDHDYVVVLNFADSTIRLVCKRLFAVQDIGPSAQRVIAIKGFCPAVPHIRIVPSQTENGVRTWWETNMGRNYC
jgi:hypothetical protein